MDKFTEEEWDEFIMIYDDAVADYREELGIVSGMQDAIRLDIIRDKIYQLAPVEKDIPRCFN